MYTKIKNTKIFSYENFRNYGISCFYYFLLFLFLSVSLLSNHVGCGLGILFQILYFSRYVFNGRLMLMSASRLIYLYRKLGYHLLSCSFYMPYLFHPVPFYVCRTACILMILLPLMRRSLFSSLFQFIVYYCLSLSSYFHVTNQQTTIRTNIYNHVSQVKIVYLDIQGTQNSTICRLLCVLCQAFLQHLHIF